MSSSIESLIKSGTKLWLDSIDPILVDKNRALGATGATSNPIIIADLINTGRFDDQIQQLIADEKTDEEIAWCLADELVGNAQRVFLPVWEESHGNDGYVSFELDPIIEDTDLDLPQNERIAKYIDLGKQWSASNPNRMIKVPATPAGIGALEELTAAGVPLNVTLIFTQRQYEQARDAVWHGAQRLDNLASFKSVYSIFVSRIDVYTQKNAALLSESAQGMVGIVNAQRIWDDNQTFWADKQCPLQQEIIFASTGTKRPEDPKWKYVAALAGSDIQTNPPATNDAVAESGVTFTRQIDQWPAKSILDDIDQHVDFAHLETTLMAEGIAKFATPQHGLLALIGEKRNSFAVS